MGGGPGREEVPTLAGPPEPVHPVPQQHGPFGQPRPAPPLTGPILGTVRRQAGLWGGGQLQPSGATPAGGRLLALQEQTARKGPQEVCKSARERVSVRENEGAGAGLNDCAQPCVGELSVSGCTRVCVAQWVSVGVRVNRCK